MRNYSLYLSDLVEAMEAIEKFVEGMDLEGFKKNDMVSSALTRKFEVVGEAAKNIPEEIRNRYLQVPRKEMAGMRDRLIHFYFGINFDLVWHTIKDVIPQVKPVIHKIIEDIATRK